MNIFDIVSKEEWLIPKNDLLAKVQNFTTIKVQGDLDEKNILIFESEVNRILSPNGRNIYLDFSEVTSIVSSAIGSLLLYQDSATRKGYTFHIVSVNDKIKNIFLTLGLERLLAL